MSTIPVAISAPEIPWTLPSRGRVGMLSLIAAESAIFTIFVVAYLFYLGKSLAGPTPAQVLHVPIFNTICLLSSSLTIHLAVRALRAGRTAIFNLCWFLTWALGTIFLIGTGREWHHLIYDEGLTISTNLFGTTYYSLVGLHAFHVTAGLIGLAVVMVLALAGKVSQEHAERVDVLSLYWHFVDVVWVVVFTVVYIIGK
jgi:cytochrome c oxidase subunit III